LFEKTTNPFFKKHTKKKKITLNPKLLQSPKVQQRFYEFHQQKIPTQISLAKKEKRSAIIL
jgi:hypothetical protein